MIYIAASDLVPEIKSLNDFAAAVTHFSIFALGLALTLGIAGVMPVDFPS